MCKGVKIYNIPNILHTKFAITYDNTPHSHKIVSFNDLDSIYDYNQIYKIYNCKYYMNTLNKLTNLDKYDKYTILYQIYFVLNLLTQIMSHNDLTINNIIYYEVPNNKRIKVDYIYNNLSKTLYVKYIPYIKNFEKSFWCMGTITQYTTYSDQIDLAYYIQNKGIFNEFNTTDNDLKTVATFYNFLNNYVIDPPTTEYVLEKKYDFDNDASIKDVYDRIGRHIKPSNMPMPIVDQSLDQLPDQSLDQSPDQSLDQSPDQSPHLLPDQSLDQTPKKKFTIMTFNLRGYNTHLNKYHSIHENYFTEILQFLGNNFPDIICTQEDIEQVFYNKINNEYKLSLFTRDFTYGDRGEIVGVYINNNNKIIIQNKESFNSTFQQLQGMYQHNFTTRYGIVFEYDGIKIANVHLIGGAEFDPYMENNEYFKHYIEFRKELLIKAIKHKPDIIVGDFNIPFAKNQLIFKDYITNLLVHLRKNTKIPNSLSKIPNSLSKIPNSLSIIPDSLYGLQFAESIVSEIISVLELNGYTYLVPCNEKLITNIRATAITDMIWYKSEKVKPSPEFPCAQIYNHEAIDDLNRRHFPVIGTFMY